MLKTNNNFINLFIDLFIDFKKLLKYFYILIMETTKNKLTSEQMKFFKKLSNYLDTKLYYYGSIQRNDYLFGTSDIDVCIFTNNNTETKYKLVSFLGLKKKEYKKIVLKLHQTNKLVYGYKIKYKNEQKNINVEFAIYNEKDKQEVLIEHNFKSKLPFYISWLIILNKFFYHTLPIMPKSFYNNCKRFLMDYMLQGKDSEFVVID
jgi:predicted nucleotidyltransferase